MGRPSRTPCIDREQTYRAAFDGTCPMRNDEFEQIAAIIPARLGNKRRAGLRKAVESGWLFYKMGLTAVEPKDASFKRILETAAKLAKKVKRALGKEQDWNRRQACIKNLQKINDRLTELSGWTSPLGMTFQSTIVLLRSYVIQASRSGITTEIIKALADELARILVAAMETAKKAPSKHGQQSKAHAKNWLAQHLDDTYRCYSWDPERKDRNELIEELATGTPLQICDEANRRDEWVALVLKVIGVEFPNLDDHRAEFRAMFCR